MISCTALHYEYKIEQRTATLSFANEILFIGGQREPMVSGAKYGSVRIL
jgi:hypothetical protein